MDIGTPERYLQATWDILEGTVRDRARSGDGGPYVAADAEIARRCDASTARAVIRAGSHGRRWRRRSPSPVLLDDCRIGPGATSAASILAPASRSARARRIAAGCVIGEGAQDRGRARWSRRIAGPARRARRGRGRRVSASARRDPGGRLAPTSSTTSSRSPTTSATRSGGSSRPGSSRSRPSGLVVCGMGGSAIGGGPGRAPRSATGSACRCWSTATTSFPPGRSPDRAVLCSSYSGDTEETLACFAAAEALGARALRRDHRRRARRCGPRGRRPGGRAAGGPAAARCGRLHVHGRRARSRRWSAPPPGCGPRSTAAAAHLRGRSATRWSPRAAEIAAQLEGTVPGDLRLRPDRRRSPTAGRRRSTRTPSSPRSTTSCPSSTTTRSSAGPDAERGQALLGGLPRGLRPAPARARARRADREADRATAGGRGHGSRPRARPASSGCCGR